MIGERVLRSEDPRLLTGAGRYTADVGIPDQAYVAFVRSPYAHADVMAVDVTGAASAVGVFAVLTGQDYESDGLMSLLYPSSLPDHLDPTKPHQGRVLSTTGGDANRDRQGATRW